jgi:initiation factor 1A
MVKNTKGGSGHKSQARKHTYDTGSKKTRVSVDEMEIYACVISILGGANCTVKCVDGQDRLCIIRGKFRGGKGKRGNMLCRGTWVLVGIREWSSDGASDKESRKCDLLEVYNDFDKQELKKIRGFQWDIIDINDVISGKSINSDMITFSNSAHMSDYEELVQKSEGEIVKLQVTPTSDQPEANSEDEVDIDDI